jgi:serine protease AprX
MVAAAVTLPVAGGAVTAAGATATATAIATGSAIGRSSAGHSAGSSAWASNLWSGSAATGTPTSLSAVRQIIGATASTTSSLTGKGVGIALIDTGVAPVPGLPAAQVVNGPDLSFESQSSSLRYLDTYGHGTHMAGIIVGNDTATGTKGIAPRAKLTSIKIGTSNGAVDVSQTIAAVDWVVQHRADDSSNPIRVINLSYGSGGNPPTWTDPLGYAVEKAWQAGIVVIAAAGNNGSQATMLTNPATDEWIISVGAADTKGTVTGSDDALASFTNLPTNGGKQVNLLAPGVSIPSLRDPGSNIDLSFPSARQGSTLFRGSGTSQATAVTSAAAALLLQAKPSATPNQIRDWLQQSSTYIPNGSATTLGLRMINVSAALARANSNAQAAVFNWKASSGTGTIEAARGASHVVDSNTSLTGEKTVWGALSTTTWAPRSAAHTAWSGGLWMGFRVAGDGWTGSSWASRTWAPATWTSKPWNGASSWVDTNWSHRTWAAGTWSSGNWVSRTWASDDWSSAAWQ